MDIKEFIKIGFLCFMGIGGFTIASSMGMNGEFGVWNVVGFLMMVVAVWLANKWGYMSD